MSAESRLRLQAGAAPRWVAGWLAIAAAVGTTGCQTTRQDPLPGIAQSDIPRELSKVSMPTYRVEPPDILLIESVNNIRPADSALQANDEIVIRVSNAIPPPPPDQAPDPLNEEFRIINGIYRIQANGTVDLGPLYGTVAVEGLTVPEASTAIRRHIEELYGIEGTKVSISLPDISGKQDIAGEHLVRLDGTISLGIYGSVYVAGMTLEEIKDAVERHLSQYLHRPEVNVDVLAYNSKVIYIITDGGGFGEQVVRLPCTGNETVLDALSQIQGLSEVSSKQMWVSRPAPAGTDVAQNLYVDYRAITQDGVTTTNYQLFPGDRIYIKADRWISLDNALSKITAPMERIFGVTLLGNSTVRALQRGSGAVGGGFF